MSIVQANFQHNDWAELCVMVHEKASVIDISIFVVVSHSHRLTGDGFVASHCLCPSPLTPIMNECDEMEPSQSPFRFPFLLPFFDFALCSLLFVARPFRPRKEAAQRL